MSERERWIVYPLLFLALGAALRDKLFDQTTSKRIVCQELTVVDEAPAGREPILLARIGRLEQAATGATAGGFLFVNGHLTVGGNVDAQGYAIRGVPLLPSWQTIMSPEFRQALQRALRGATPPVPQAAPPTDGSVPPAEPARQSEPATDAPADSNPPTEVEDN